jgi:ferredoxin
MADKASPWARAVDADMPTTRRYSVIVEGGESFPCADGERVLVAMERAGRKGIAVGCRGGGCGVCRVQVMDGRYSLGKTSRSRLSDGDRAQGYALSCQLYPLSDIVIRIRECSVTKHADSANPSPLAPKY